MPRLSELRLDARRIYDAALAAADPYAAVKRNVQIHSGQLYAAGRAYDLKQFSNILIAGCGKASARMALAIEELLGDKITAGMIVVKYGHGVALNRIDVIEAGHPIPDNAGLDGARRVADLLSGRAEHDLVLFLISGGGSALLPLPARGLSLADKQQTTDVLLKSGATIGEINAVRKHLSRVKGGRLARLAAPATIIALILSDVIGDSLGAIASGPTAPDDSTYKSCLEILDRYDVRRNLPVNVVDHLKRGAAGEHEETPKAGDPIFDKVQNLIVGSNRIALSRAHERASELGYHTVVLTEAVEGESRLAARKFAALVKAFTHWSRPVCLISGGETTVTVRGDGLGGRNQEFALAAAVEIAGQDNIVVLSGGTDGTDGPTDAAGGIIDGFSVERGSAAGFRAENCLKRNDSYGFLRASGDLLITGPTLTNVMDIQVALVT